MKPNFFPHFSLSFSALVAFLLSLLFFILTLANYHTQLFPENEAYVILKLNLLQHPQSPQAQEDFQKFLNQNLSPQKIKELGLTDKITQNLSPILGTTTSNEDEKSASDNLSFWKNIVSIYPYYRDGYLYYGKALIEANSQELGKEMLERGFQLDPLYNNSYFAGFVDSP